MATSNPKISVYVTPELKKKLAEYSKTHDAGGLSGAVVAILKEHFGDTNATSNTQVTQLWNAISELTKRVDTLEKKKQDRTTQKQSRVKVETSNAQSNVKVTQSNANGWLTTGEAYSEAQKKGYDKAIGTFRRTLRGGKVSKELEKLGLVANFEARKQANPKDNSVKWLRFEGL